jgi:hypothetical protein
MPQGGLQFHEPQVAAMLSDAQKVYEDGWSLFNGIRKLVNANTLFAGYPCRIWDISDTIPVAPEGGALGWMLTVRVQLDGFDPPGA